MQSKFILIVVLTLPWVGCHTLPSGQINAVGAKSLTSRRGSIYLIRGWRDLYSMGMDQLAGELRSSGIDATVYREEQWRELAEAIDARYQPTSAHEPLVLIGFSYGADDVLKTALQLDHRGIVCDAVITIDPVTPPKVPGNVRVCYNFFQTNRIWDLFPWFRGVPLESEQPGNLMNINLRKDHPELLEPNTGHTNIAANPRIHRAIIDRVLMICTPRASGK
jgi:pimeloyl-ACP methyl ester carboxylesterase